MSTHGSHDAAIDSTYRRQTPMLLEVIGHSIWRALERAGQRRAARELRGLAERWEPFDPALAQQLREAGRHDTAR